MFFELCKKKTKCSTCKTIMKAGEIRSVQGGSNYNDPLLYKCLECTKKEEFNFDELIKIYKTKIKEYETKINKINELRKLI